jgi:hypothetical protein
LNGKPGDNPLTDLVVHGAHPFPDDIEKMLVEIDAIGREQGWWPLGENWPYSPDEFAWERGEDLDRARSLLSHLLEMMQEGRGEVVLHDLLTRKPIRSDD